MKELYHMHEVQSNAKLMAMPISHRFTSTQAQGADATKVSKNEWNDTHKFDADGVVAGQRVGTTEDRWYCQEMYGSTALVAASPTIGRLRAYPYVPAKDMTLDRLAVEVTTAQATGQIRIGLYADSGNLYPTTLLNESAALAASTVGAKTHTMSRAVTGGELYWLATVTGVAATAMRCLPIAEALPILGFGPTLGSLQAFGWDVAHAFAALPNPFTAGATPQTAAPIPAVFVRGV